VTWGTPVQSFVFLGLLVFELEPMYVTSDGQTDGRTDGRTTDADDRLMPPPPPPPTGRGHNKCIEDDTKPPLAEAQTALGKQNNEIRRRTIFNMADGIFFHPAMWHVALG